MIRPYRGTTPKVAPSAYVDSSAQIIGDVWIGERSSIWPCAVLRGDVGAIRIGDDTSIQDCSVLHQDEGFSMIVGNRVTVGHCVTLHGCVVEDDCVVGIGATILNGARLGAGSVIGAGALVPEGMQVPAGSVIMGVPGKVRRQVTEAERARFAEGVKHYVGKARIYKEGSQ